MGGSKPFWLMIRFLYEQIFYCLLDSFFVFYPKTKKPMLVVFPDLFLGKTLSFKDLIFDLFAIRHLKFFINQLV